MAAIALPDVGYQVAYPQLVESVSMARAGNRAMAFVEFADPTWQITMRTVPLKAGPRLAVEAFRDATRGGLQTVRYSPTHMCIPRAYWGDADNPALDDSGNLVSITDGRVLAVSSVSNGLTLGAGDLISLATGDYRSLHRIQSGGVAASSAISVTVEPPVPGYIAAGAVVKFKAPELNMRVLPGSFSIPDELFPVASFTLVEVPK
ncbi:hypothetical protein [Aminobacter niigataensis]|uniref:hypothetical protein n=1 Tax=Aminobacter niigataensis TaxID=83265 RepID=UPI00298F308B|nr:hypothetical protein [Aminobacter niigataensis]